MTTLIDLTTPPLLTLNRDGGGAEITIEVGAPGPEGDPGPPGLPGVNAVPADTAVGTYLGTPGTASRIALDEAAADELDDTTSATYAALARATAARESRRTRLAALMTYGAGPWWLMRESARAYHFVRSLGAGEWFAQSFEDDTTDPGGTRTLRMKTTVRGRLVRLQQANVATFAGGTWSHTPPTDITLGYKPETVIVDAVAGNSYVDVPAGGLTSTLHASRRITVPGAGAAGADLVLTTGTVASSTRVNLTGGTVGTTVTGATSTFWTRQRRAETAGATATWTSPAGTIHLGMVTTRHTQGGLFKVSIDSDPTAATLLPTAQMLVDAGRYASSVLVGNGGTLNPTDRVFDSVLNSVQYVEPILFAANLAPAAHTVVVTVTGYQAPNQTGTPNARVFVGGWLWADGTETPATAGDLRVAEAALLTFDGAQESSVEHNGNGAGAQVFVGSKHGYETTTSLVFYNPDGTTMSLTNWTAAPAEGATIVKRTTLSHPSATGTQFFDVTYTYRLHRGGITVHKVTTVLAATNVGHDYPFMWSANGAIYDTAQFDASPASFTVTAADDSKKGTSKSTSAVLWDADGKDAVALVEPHADRITLDWSDNTLANVQDRAISSGRYKLNKVYIGSAPGAVAAGTIWDQEATYMWLYARSGLPELFPVP